MNKIILGFILTGLIHLEAPAAPNVAAYLGDYNFVALAADGTVWGSTHFNSYDGYDFLCGESYGGVADIAPDAVGQVRGLRDVVAVSGSAALKTDGTVWTWRHMVYMRVPKVQIGANMIALPRGAEQVPGLSDVKQIVGNFNRETEYSAGFALKKDGSVWKWDYQTDAFDPQKPCRFRKQVLMPAEKVASIDQVVSLALYRKGVVALKADGTVWTWGNGPPTRIQNLENVSAIFAGRDNAYALKADGSLFGWGDNSILHLGATHMELGDSATPVAIPDLGNDVKRILIGSEQMGVVKRDGSVWAWGLGLGGAICPEGNAPCPQDDYLTPVKLRGVGDDYLSISAGEYNFTLVKPDGSIYVIGLPQTNYGINVDRTLAQGGRYFFTHFPSLNLLKPPQKTDTDRILDWAEQDYANYFAPSGIATRSAASYEFRYYPQTNSHLGTKDKRVWYRTRN